MTNEYYNPQVTVFKSLFNANDTPYKVLMTKIMARVRDGLSSSRGIIEQIRKSNDQNEVDRLKKMLPALMFNGIFKTRSDVGIESHSGLCIFDFDKYPSQKELNQERALIQSDPYTYACFLSPSGKGLKVIVKIPKSNKDEHFRRFHSYKNYIKSDFFDDKNSNLSRVCFESYDPNFYFNPESQLYEGINELEEKKFINSSPVVLLNDESKIIENIMKFKLNNAFVEGNRNAYIFELACIFCEYDINQSTSEYYLGSFAQQGFGKEEIVRTIKSAYKKSGTNPKKYFEDYQLKNQIEQKIKEGEDVKQIAKELKIDEQSVKDVKNEINDLSNNFWEVIKTRRGKEIKIISNIYNNFLTTNGFKKYYPEKSETPVFVRVVENKVKIISTDQIKDFVLTWLRDKKEIDVWNVMAERTSYFNEKYLNYLDPIYLKMIQDTKDTAYIPYKNGVLKVTKDKRQLIDYIDIDYYIWENQIIDRNYIESSDTKNDFQDFVSKVTNDNSIRTLALECTIGYLIHAYKDKTHQKAIIFNDQEIDDNPNGGSGKSLMVTALSKFRNVVKIDGKHFNPLKSDFVYQRVNLDTQILAFDDVKRNFDLEQLFAIITEGITVNRKNKDEIFIPFDRSPKIVITTNYVIGGAGESHDRRRHEIEFYQYFNKKNNPLKVYGKLLFDQWDKKDWVSFDNYMVENLQKYLIHGLIISPSINVDAKRFISSTCKEFFDFMHEGFIEFNKLIYNSEAINLFIKENKAFKDLDSRKFMKWLGEYCLYKSFKLKKGKDHKGRWLMIVTVPEEEDQMKINL